jgi:hypothetical protein
MLCAKPSVGRGEILSPECNDTFLKEICACKQGFDFGRNT